MRDGGKMKTLGLRDARLRGTWRMTKAWCGW